MLGAIVCLLEDNGKTRSAAFVKSSSYFGGFCMCNPVSFNGKKIESRGAVLRLVLLYKI